MHNKALHGLLFAASPIVSLKIAISHAHLQYLFYSIADMGGSVAEWLACWTQAQKGLGSNRSRDAVR